MVALLRVHWELIGLFWIGPPGDEAHELNKLAVLLFVQHFIIADQAFNFFDRIAFEVALDLLIVLVLLPLCLAISRVLRLVLDHFDNVLVLPCVGSF